MSFSLFRSIQFGVFLAVIYYATIFDSGDSIKEETNKTVFNILKKKQSLKKIATEEKGLKEFPDIFDNLALQMGSKILSILNSYSEGSSFPVFLSNQAKQLDLYILSLGRVVASKEKEWEVQEIQLSLEGSYHQLMQFIANIQNKERLVIIKQNTVKLSGSGSSLSAKNSLQASLSVKLYQFAKEKEE